MRKAPTSLQICAFLVTTGYSTRNIITPRSVTVWQEHPRQLYQLGCQPPPAHSGQIKWSCTGRVICVDANFRSCFSTKTNHWLAYLYGDYQSLWLTQIFFPALGKMKNEKISFTMDSQQGPTVQHRELCSVLYDSLDRRGIWGRMDMYAWVILLSPKTITTLSIRLYSNIK